MKIVCLADLHGHLPKLPKADVVCIAGDICPDGSVLSQHDWLHKDFRKWLEEETHGAKVIATWGNHDFIGETNFIPTLNWEILVNRTVEYQGYKFSGFPWTTVSTHWAFHKPRVACESWAAMFYHDLETDVLLSHTPPYGVGDCTRSGEKVGSFELGKFLGRGQPKVCITGHIHEGRGQYFTADGSLVLNASYLDEYYRPYKLDVPVIELV